MLEHIIPSRARKKVLELFFHHPKDTFYLRQIVRTISEEVNAVKRELDILTDEKLLLKERRLNKIFYTLNKNYPFYDEFMRIFAKTGKLMASVRDNLSRLGKVRFAVVSMKFPKREEIREDEIYFLFVGIIVVPEVAALIKQGETEFGREINYTVMTEEEFAFRKRNNDPFIWRFLKHPYLMLIGQMEDLTK